MGISEIVSKEWSDVVAFGNRDEMKMVYDNIRLPNFHTDLESRLTDFGGINWTKSQDRMRYGLDLINEHLFKIYRDIMDADGWGEDFDNYIFISTSYCINDLDSFNEKILSKNNWIISQFGKYEEAKSVWSVSLDRKGFILDLTDEVNEW